MIILLGALIVLGSVIGGYVITGGNVLMLLHLGEFVIIGGATLGSLIIMSPKRVLIDLTRQVGGALKGSPYSREAYEEVFKALYELFMIGRRNGMIALEDHVLNPLNSSILAKYPGFLQNTNALNFFCGAMRPIVDGRVKPDQLKMLLDVELHSMEDENSKPVSVLTRAGDALPGFGIVAAVMGIVVTMASIAGPIEEVGMKVAAALVGTFLGIFLAYGFVNPLAVNLEFLNMSRVEFNRCIATSVVGFANGMAPIMAVELARRGLSSEVKPTSDELEAMLKSVMAPAKQPG
jgi:chemotaxis protein MotA